jgi:hypothetical protein
MVHLECISPADLDIIASGCAAAEIELAGSPYSRFQRTTMYTATKIPPALTQGVVDAAVTGALFGFVCVQ